MDREHKITLNKWFVLVTYKLGSFGAEAGVMGRGQPSWNEGGPRPSHEGAGGHYLFAAWWRPIFLNHGTDLQVTITIR